MAKEIIVNARPYETRVAIMETGKPAELFLERGDRNIVGNIYKGKVVKVLPGMQSAFVNIGLDKDAFLYVEDVIANLEKMLELWSEADITKGKGKRVKTRKHKPIRELLREGEHILVQVAKERIGGKGARVTSHVSLAGKYMVLMPTVNRIGISRKITSPEERKRLRDFLLEYRDPQLGYIIRTAAQNSSKKDIVREIGYLHDMWAAITDAADRTKEVGLLYSEPGLLQRILRDVFSSDFSGIIIDDEEAYMAAVDFIERNQKRLVNRVRLYSGKQPIFEEYGIDEVIDNSLRGKVALSSGGHIVIHQTEALVAIDVNTGRFVGSKDLEDTALKVNKEAARAIVTQLRLRDLGGIIVIDFIDMEKKANRTALMQYFHKELEKDGAERTVLDLNEFGLVIITRKRVRRSLERQLALSCPYCGGRGLVKSPETVACEVMRELEKIASEGVRAGLRVITHPEVTEHLGKVMGGALEVLTREGGFEISLVADDGFHHEQYDIVEI
jgi:ribonuclease G